MPNIQPHLAASLNIQVRMASAVNQVPATSCRLLFGNYSLEECEKVESTYSVQIQSKHLDFTWFKFYMEKEKNKAEKAGRQKKEKNPTNTLMMYLYKQINPKSRADVLLRQHMCFKNQLVRLEIFSHKLLRSTRCFSSMTVVHQQQHFSPCPGSIEKKHQITETTTP